MVYDEIVDSDEENGDKSVKKNSETLFSFLPPSAGSRQTSNDAASRR